LGGVGVRMKNEELEIKNKKGRLPVIWKPSFFTIFFLSGRLRIITGHTIFLKKLDIIKF
jgi:hypothetical protein